MARQCYLGIDWGRNRSGVALAVWDADASPSFQTAIRYSALPIIQTSSRQVLIQSIGKLVREWSVNFIVIGALPPHPNTLAPRQTTLIAQKLARQLHAQLSIGTALADETLTSAISDCHHPLHGKTALDSLSAIEILRGYLSAKGIAICTI